MDPKKVRVVLGKDLLAIGASLAIGTHFTKKVPDQTQGMGPFARALGPQPQKGTGRRFFEEGKKKPLGFGLSVQFF
jgi:hypothetical protein